MPSPVPPYSGLQAARAPEACRGGRGTGRTGPAFSPSRARSSLLSPENFLEGGVGYTCQDFKGGPRIYPRGGCCIYGRVMHLQGAEPPRRGATSPRGISRTRGSCIMGGGISHPRGSQPPRGKWCPSRGGFLRSGDHVLRGRESHDRWRIELPASVRRPLTSGRACSAGRLV